AFIVINPDFLSRIPTVVGSQGQTNFNLAVPVFCLNYLPHGIIGLIMVALFSAAMSSLDSTINSLSATTIRDIIERFFVGHELEAGKQLYWSRLTTVFWGAVCIIFSFFVGGISSSIVESINKIGSLAYGPILATFLLAILTRKANDKGTIAGIVAGFGINIYLWVFHPDISWMWWNVIGCVVTFIGGYLISLILGGEEAVPDNIDDLVYNSDSTKSFNFKRNWPVYYGVLVGYFALMIVVLKLIEKSFV
ncbi:MAG: sodium:proline symporter, partial [bacterium]|nr:sodium:proline symporter [bacterium]